MRSATPPASAVRSTRTWLPPDSWDWTSPEFHGSHVPVNLHASLPSPPYPLSPRRLTHFPPKIARRSSSPPRQDVCQFHPPTRPQGPTALAAAESRTPTA